MLVSLSIENFTILEKSTISFRPGMTVITGETGAGKSILINALLFSLGKKQADSQLIKIGTQSLTVLAHFDITTLPIAQECLGCFLPLTTTVTLKRTMSLAGKSRCYINNQLVSLKTLRQIGNCLIELHGQTAHYQILNPAVQADMYDKFGNYFSIKDEVKTAYKEWQVGVQALKKWEMDTQTKHLQLDFMHHQLNEIQSLNLAKGELVTLENEQLRLSHAHDLIKMYQVVTQGLRDHENFNAEKLLQNAMGQINRWQSLDPKLTAVMQLLNEASIHLAEALKELDSYFKNIELNEQHQEFIEARLTKIYDIARKYHLKPVQLIDKLNQLEEECAQLDNSEEYLSTRRKQVDSLRQEYLVKAQLLSNAREHQLQSFNEQMTKVLRDLNLFGCDFEVRLKTCSPNFNATGLETIEFFIITNPGQPFQALGEIGSGGELSRINLALQIVTLKHERNATLILDEIDVGLGGKIAETMGAMLRKMGQKQQILCITHLPQVAAAAHQHIHVNKIFSQDTTQACLQVLSDQQRPKEIARMLGSDTDDKTMAFVKELMHKSDYSLST